jgi:hypothetical protein
MRTRPVHTPSRFAFLVLHCTLHALAAGLLTAAILAGIVLLLSGCTQTTG